MTIHWPIVRTLLSSPRRTLIVDDRRTYRAIDILVGALHIADAIDAAAKSPRVGVMLPSSGAFPIAMLGTWIAGRTLVPLNFLLKPEELQYVVNDSGIDVIFTSKMLIDHMGVAPVGPRLIAMEDLDFRSVPSPRLPAFTSDDELAVLLYTSGTSGRPKGVMLTHANISANIRQVREWVDFGSNDVMLGVLPQFHSFGLTVLTVMPLTAAMRVVYSARFVPQRIVKLFREHRPTVFVAIPSMYAALLSVKDAGPDDFASLRYIVSGAEPLSDAIAERFRERFGKTICQGFGLTETAPATNWCRPHEFRPRSVGRAIPEVDIRIVDGSRVLPPNTDGEVRIKGPNVMRGYYHLPVETAAAFDESGYFRTGDIGRVDDDGHLFITGRIKEMMIIGGENVFPREIEEVIDRHPAVQASGVVGRPDPLRGEQPVAFVELREGIEAKPSEITSWCRDRLAGYKVPSEVRILAALPRNPTGKVMRRELKAMLSSSDSGG